MRSGGFSDHFALVTHQTGIVAISTCGISQKAYDKHRTVQRCCSHHTDQSHQLSVTVVTSPNPWPSARCRSPSTDTFKSLLFYWPQLLIWQHPLLPNVPTLAVCGHRAMWHNTWWDDVMKTDVLLSFSVFLWLPLLIQCSNNGYDLMIGTG